MGSVRVGVPEDDPKFLKNCDAIWQAEKMDRGMIREKIRNCI